MEICAICAESDFQKCVQVIRESFHTISEQFGLTKENCPSHPAFMEIQDLKNIIQRGATVFGAFDKDELVGVVVTEEVKPGLFSMEKLAVLPGYRHMGVGASLVKAVVDYAQRNNAKQIDIGIIDENSVLKEWYCSQGFIETEKRQFAHLPFTVCFMQAHLEL